MFNNNNNNNTNTHTHTHTRAHTIHKHEKQSENHGVLAYITRSCIHIANTTRLQACEALSWPLCAFVTATETSSANGDTYEMLT
jgi:hypothetical protein